MADKKLTLQEESLDLLHSSIREGEDLIENLAKQLEDFYIALDYIKEHLCAGEICSVNCDNVLHCHNKDHHEHQHGAYCLVPLKKDEVEEKK